MENENLVAEQEHQDKRFWEEVFNATYNRGQMTQKGVEQATAIANAALKAKRDAFTKPIE